jgi:hypothetical protein
MDYGGPGGEEMGIGLACDRSRRPTERTTVEESVLIGQPSWHPLMVLQSYFIADPTWVS